MSEADAIGFAGFLALLVWAGRRRATSPTGFLVAERTLGLFPLVATLVMTEFNTSTLLAFSAAGYRAGPMALALPIVFLIGLAFYTMTVAKPWKRFNRLSVAELFAERYSASLARFAAIMLLAAMLGFSATYVKSMGLIVQPFVPAMPFAVLTAILCTVVLMVILPGGLLSVVRSDVVSFVATLLVFPWLLWLSARDSAAAGGLAVAFPPDQRLVHPIDQWTHPALPFWFVTSLIVLTCFTYIAAPWYGQKIFAARDERTAFAAVAWTSVLVCALYGTAVLAAAHFRASVPTLADPQLAMPEMMRLLLPAGARGVGIALLFAAALTTLGGAWTAMAAMVVADFGWMHARVIPAQRLLLTGFAVASWIAGVTLVDDILNRLILANIPVAALAFALLAGFHWPRATTAGAWASVTVGMLWGVGSFMLIGEGGGYTWTWAIYGIPLIFTTGVCVSLFGHPSTTRPVRRGNGR